MWCIQMLLLGMNVYPGEQRQLLSLSVRTISKERCLLVFEKQIHFSVHVLTIRFDTFIRDKISECHLRSFSFCFSRASLRPENHRLPFSQLQAYYPSKNWKVQAINICNWRKGKDKKVSFISVMREHVQCGN